MPSAKKRIKPIKLWKTCREALIRSYEQKALKINKNQMIIKVDSI